MVTVISSVRTGKGCQSLSLLMVALLLDLGEERERNVEHVVLRPYLTCGISREPAIRARRGELQRNLVFIVIALIV